MSRKSTEQLIRDAEEPDNPQHTSRYAEENHEAERELKDRGFSDHEIRLFRIGRGNEVDRNGR